jgi:hypothetical protein
MTRKRQKTTSLLASLPQELRLSLASTKSAVVTEVQGERLDEDERPTKRRKMDNILPKSNEKYDATGLAPFYTTANQVPAKLKKCASLRYLHEFLLTSTGRFLSALQAVFKILGRLPPG